MTAQHPARPGETAFDSPFDAATDARVRETLTMVRRALDERRVTLAYQPVVQARLPARAAFFEGFMRILAPDSRIIPARDFMPECETSELGRRIDCMALEMGLAALTQEPGLRLAINLSARSIGWPAWLAALERGLRNDPTVAERLILEITESSAIIMPDLVSVFMADMQARGICFALDDFGAGYTAFRYLKDFYFDIVKIDGQFIRDIARNPDNQVLTQALISIARHFDMFTVAESVETAEDARYLVEIGVDCLQGYYFGAPSTELPAKSPRFARSA